MGQFSEPLLLLLALLAVACLGLCAFFLLGKKVDRSEADDLGDDSNL
jgi:hypothetical protein